MKRLLKTIQGENGELFALVDGNRVLLANCKSRFELFEERVDVPILGTSCKVKSYKFVIVLCDELDYTREVSIDYLRKVRGFDLTTDIQRTDRVFEVVKLNNIIPTEIELDGQWSFEVTTNKELINKIFNL